MRGGTARERGGIITFLMGVVVVLAVGAGAFWWFFLRGDAAPKPKIEDTPVVAGGTLDGTWALQPGGHSFVQYRAKEQFAAATIETDATGRTDDVQATMTIDGTTVSGVRVTANLATLKSDKDRRDEKIKTDGLQTNEFPNATFVQTQPITLPEAPQKGTTVSTAAIGSLTLHGITRRVSVPLDGRWDGHTVQVVGELPIRFAEYGITPPNIGGFVNVAPNGHMELNLVFTKG
jgi:polyisoprenoid-binding protein YceI